MDNLARQLRQVRKCSGMTQRELGELLGVGQTAIANYEQGNRSPDTQGLHRMADVLGVTIDELLGRGGKQDSAPAAHSLDRNGWQPAVTYNKPAEVDFQYETDRYITGLLGKNPTGAIDRIINIAALGVPITAIYRNILEPASQHSKTRPAGKISVYQEHLLIQGITSCMVLLKEHIKRKSAGGRRFMGVTVDSEVHNVGLMMVCDLMYMEGWEVMYLKSSPFGRELVDVVKTYAPDVVGLSVSMPSNIPTVEEFISAIRKKCPVSPPFIVVGGTAFLSESGLWQKMRADAFAPSGAEAAPLLTKLL